MVFREFNTYFIKNIHEASKLAHLHIKYFVLYLLIIYMKEAIH